MTKKLHLCSLNKSKKQIFIASESQSLYTTSRLISEASQLGMNANWFNPYESLISLNTQCSQIGLPGLYFLRTSGTRYDDFDLIVARYYHKCGHTITNPLEATTIFRSKDHQALFFNHHQLPSVNSILYRGCLNEKYWDEICSLSQDEKYILKMVRGNQGTGVNLIVGHQSLKSILETFHALKDQKFLLQPYVEHKREWRFFLIKNEIIGAIQKNIHKDDFRGNSKRSSGKYKKIIPKDLREIVRNAAQLSRLDYCGIDIMETKNGPVFLEINPVPGFEQMESLSGLNIARELLTKIN